MRILLLIFILSCSTVLLTGQNCNAYLYGGDTLQYEACVIAEGRSGHYQFSWEYQHALEKAVDHCPYFSYGYRHMSVAYLKSGDFINWKRLMDLAVHYDPLAHLGYRGWCRYQFFRDYKGAIEDIEALDRLVDYEIGQCQNGVYHLNIAKGLCYKAIGEKEKALQIISDQILENEKQDFVGAYDYLHQGVLLFELDRVEEALIVFEKQQAYNDLAENQYYKALVFKQLGKSENFQKAIELAKTYYVNGDRVRDTYSNPLATDHLLSFQYIIIIQLGV